MRLSVCPDIRKVTSCVPLIVRTLCLLVNSLVERILWIVFDAFGPFVEFPISPAYDALQVPSSWAPGVACSTTNEAMVSGSPSGTVMAETPR